MKPGSVIVDLAVRRRRQLRGHDAGRTHRGQRRDHPRLPQLAGPDRGRGQRRCTRSNLLTFLTTFWDKDAKAPKLPETDDIIKGVMLTRGGAVVHPSFLPHQAA